MDLRRSLRRRTAAAFLAAVALVSSLALTPAPAALGSAPKEGALSPALFRMGLEANGTVVRQGGGVAVSRVVVTHDGAERVVYRVRVGGSFPPRALRYIVFADGEQIGYGLPTPNEHAVETVTTDAGVLEATIAARYEGAASAGLADRPSGANKALEKMPDPGLPGPHEVSVEVYDLGDEVFQPTGLGRKVELTAEVQYPTDLDNGPYPLVLFLHGNHSSCFKGEKDRFQWPCRPGWEPLPNYAGYGYISERLASNGYIVVSVSANGVNVFGTRLEDTGMRQRGELLDKHLDLWNTWSTTGGAPFDDRFVGRVDMSRIGTMGHSRGGEGVVWHKTVDEEREDPYGIDAVLSLAPVDFTRALINGVPYATMLPYCYGDVFDLQGVHFFDDSRYSMPGDPAPKHTVTLYKANHNFYNTVWSPSGGYPGGFDDGDFSNCGERLSEKRQRRIGRSYISGFFQRYLADDLSIDPMWTGAETPDYTGPAEVVVSYLAPDSPAFRMDLARFTEPSDLGDNDQGGDMLPQGLSRYGWCANDEVTPCVPEGYEFQDIHRPGLARAVVGWSKDDARLGMELLVGGRDVSSFDAFQFRTVLPPGYGANRGIKFQDLVVALIDGGGNVAEVVASDVGNDALAALPRGQGHIILNQLRFPLERFEGVDLSDIREVQLRFSRTLQGVIDIADVAFSSGGAILPPN